MNVLADNIFPTDAPFIISKLRQDAENHGYRLRSSGENYFIFWGENGYLSKISYDVCSKQITEIQLEGVKKLWSDYEL
nr:hypothetical protein [uncultured Aminipila sp.]